MESQDVLGTPNIKYPLNLILSNTSFPDTIHSFIHSFTLSCLLCVRYGAWCWQHSFPRHLHGLLPHSRSLPKQRGLPWPACPNCAALILRLGGSHPGCTLENDVPGPTCKVLLPLSSGRGLEISVFHTCLDDFSMWHVTGLRMGTSVPPLYHTWFFCHCYIVGASNTTCHITHAQ